MDSQRRQFLRLAAASTGLGLVPGSAPAASAETASAPVGMLIDSSLCIGCKACMTACDEANGLSEAQPIAAHATALSATTYNLISAWTGGNGLRKDSAPNGHAFMKQHCLHCAEPACASVCPTRAMEKDPVSGIVRHHPDRCIGCRYCISACPFNIPRYAFDDPTGQIGKCGLCEHLLDQGKIPACCDVCPTGASLFGPLEQLQEEARARLDLAPGREYTYQRGALGRTDKYPPHLHPAASYQRRIYGEKELGGTQVLYLSAVSHDKLGLPTDLPTSSHVSSASDISNWLSKYLILPGLMLFGTSLLARRALEPGYREQRSQIDEETIVLEQMRPPTDPGEVPSNVRFGRNVPMRSKNRPSVGHDNLKARILAAYRRAMRDHGVVETPLWTPTFKLLLILSLIALLLIGQRLVFGLESVSHANNGYPFSLWTILNGVVGSGLGFAGYVIAAAIYLFNKGEYSPLARSALTLGLLGYLMAGFAVLLDLGRYWNLFYLISPLHINLDSLLLQSAFCLIGYLLMLSLEFTPTLMEHAENQRWKKRIERLLYLVIGIGLTMATYHQLSLGTLLVAHGLKISSIWQSGLLPFWFLLSAVLMGLALLPVESLLASLRLESRMETSLLRKLAPATAVLLGLFIALRLIDVAAHNELPTLTAGTLQSRSFMLELFLSLTAMWLILVASKRHGPPAQPYLAGLMILLAMITYRVNAWLIGYDPGTSWSYYPSISEILISVGLFSSQILLYLIIVKKLPILRRAAPQLRPEDL